MIDVRLKYRLGMGANYYQVPSDELAAFAVPEKVSNVQLRLILDRSNVDVLSRLNYKGAIEVVQSFLAGKGISLENASLDLAGSGQAEITLCGVGNSDTEQLKTFALDQGALHELQELLVKIRGDILSLLQAKWLKEFLPARQNLALWLQ